MSDNTENKPLPPGVPNETVARSIAKPTAFSSPGTMANTGAKATNAKGTQTRFRPLAAKRGPGRQRTRKRDPRKVEFY